MTMETWRKGERLSPLVGIATDEHVVYRYWFGSFGVALPEAIGDAIIRDNKLAALAVEARALCQQILNVIGDGPVNYIPGWQDWIARYDAIATGSAEGES